MGKDTTRWNSVKATGKVGGGVAVSIPVIGVQVQRDKMDADPDVAAL